MAECILSKKYVYGLARGPGPERKQTMQTAKHPALPLAMTAVMAAVMAVVAPFSISIGPIPLSLCTLVIYMNAYILGWKRGTVATLVYILLGAVGMPVFNSFSGGLGVVAGPTGGYIVGYLPLALICGLAVAAAPKNRVGQFIGMILGTAVLYALGTAWYCVQSGNPLGVAMGYCVIPFLPGDFIKMIVAAGVGPMIRTGLEKAGLYPQG